jgi:hypothetical protein
VLRTGLLQLSTDQVLEKDMASRPRTSMTIRRALDSDLPAIEALLVRSGLPVDGVHDALGSFLVADEEGTLVGIAGVE